MAVNLHAVHEKTDSHAAHEVLLMCIFLTVGKAFLISNVNNATIQYLHQQEGHLIGSSIDLVYIVIYMVAEELSSIKKAVVLVKLQPVSIQL